jgi:hypothetical protein
VLEEARKRTKALPPRTKTIHKMIEDLCKESGWDEADFVAALEDGLASKQAAAKKTPTTQRFMVALLLEVDATDWQEAAVLGNDILKRGIGFYGPRVKGASVEGIVEQDLWDSRQKKLWEELFTRDEELD